MKLQFFDSDASAKEIIFLEDWITKNPKNKTKNFVVTKVSKVRSGKGYLLHTEAFCVFIFKNSRLAKDLVEALQVYVSSPEGGYSLVIHLPKPTDKGYMIAADKDDRVTWYEAGNEYTTLEESATLNQGQPQGNPFL